MEARTRRCNLDLILFRNNNRRTQGTINTVVETGNFRNLQRLNSWVKDCSSQGFVVSRTSCRSRNGNPISSEALKINSIDGKIGNHGPVASLDCCFIQGSHGTGFPIVKSDLDIQNGVGNLSSSIIF